jgi:RNA polymerase sigma-70 factor (ECF subfamily)
MAISSSEASIETSVDWAALYAEHIGRIYNYFRYRVGDDATAEDLTATTFEKAWRKRGQFSGDAGRFTAWLYTIARNVANDHFRKSPALVPLDELNQPAPGSLTSDLEKQLEFAKLVNHINQLPPRERDIITLKYGADLNNRQIAHQLNLSESNVGSILHRTINKLRKNMGVSHE